MTYIRYLLAVLAYVMVTNNIWADELKYGDNVDPTTLKLEQEFKIWGAAAFVERKRPHGRDVIFVGALLNHHDRRAVEQKVYNDCALRGIGNCTVVTFPGCFHAVVGQATAVNGTIKTVFGYATNKSPTDLLQDCASKNFRCSLVAGICNYMDENYRNRFALPDIASPIPNSGQWIVSSESGRSEK